MSSRPSGRVSSPKGCPLMVGCLAFARIVDCGDPQSSGGGDHLSKTSAGSRLPGPGRVTLFLVGGMPARNTAPGRELQRVWSKLARKQVVVFTHHWRRQANRHWTPADGEAWHADLA